LKKVAALGFGFLLLATSAFSGHYRVQQHKPEHKWDRSAKSWHYRQSREDDRQWKRDHVIDRRGPQQEKQEEKKWKRYRRRHK
jgi:hypothetical protein